MVKGDELIVNKYVYAALAFSWGTQIFIEKYGKSTIIYICWTGIPGVIGMIEGVIAFIKLQMSKVIFKTLMGSERI